MGVVYLYWYAVAQHVCDYCTRTATRREIDEKIRGKGGCDLKKNDNRDSKLKIIPLGGLGEIGKNMTVL